MSSVPPPVEPMLEPSAPASTALGRLADRVGVSLDHVSRSRDRARQKRSQLAHVLDGKTGPHASIVVFGSLARDEMTEGSDIDWTLLLDGPADPRHLARAQDIGRWVREVEGRGPGQEGTFGSVAFSHELVHTIGGEDDTNSNTTRRILLLLESTPVGDPQAWERVVENVLRIYLEEDRGLRFGSGHWKVPRFLLNDIVRYWRTLTVDFVYKQRSRAGRGWAIRNVKLRTSRKLLFVTGLLTCFAAHLDFDETRRKALYHRDADLSEVVEHLHDLVRLPPLEIVARALLPHPGLDEASRDLFTAYDAFLGLLADPDKRDALGRLSLADLDDPGDSLGKDVFRQGIQHGRRFQAALDRIFLDPASPYHEPMMEFAIF